MSYAKLMIHDNIGHIQGRIEAVCKRLGRKVDEITLVAVSKTFGNEVIREALDAGLLDFGENYVQEFTRKTAEFEKTAIRWHFIGHLQRNKVKDVIAKTFLIHSVDSSRLAEEISTQAAKRGLTAKFLLEVNTSGESTKFGLRPDETLDTVRSISRIPNLELEGLMTIGPFLPDPEQSRPAFRTLRELRDQAVTAGIPLRHLSMGMTNDFEVAIEEGATIIRIGTALFGKRTRSTIQANI